MMPSPFKAAAALDGYVDMGTWTALSPDAQVPYDRNDREEVRLRNPMAFVMSLRCPLTLYAGKQAQQVNDMLAAKARQRGKQCGLVVVPGDHHAMVAPAVKKAIERFRRAAGG